MALRRYIRIILPDRCSLTLPWFATGGDGSALGDLHRIAAQALRSHDKNLAPLSIPARLAHTLGALLWPVNAMARSVAATRRLGDTVRRNSGVGPVRQLAEQLWNTQRFNMAPKAYYKFRLFDRSSPWRPEQFLQDHELAVLLRLVRARREEACHLLDHKLRFWEFCSQHELPCVPILACFEPTGHANWMGSADALPPGDLVVKRVDGAMGNGFHCLIDTGSGWHSHDHTLRAPDLHELLTARARETGSTMILQPRIHNHPDLKPIAGRGLSTCRILTVASPDTGEVQAVAAALRMPVGDSPMDNIAQGGLAAAVDLESGRLSTAVAKDIGRGWFTDHPDSGARVSGRTVPFWPQAVALCLEAHRHITEVPSVGWDVAIVPEGPLLLEANTLWDPELVQVPGAHPLGATALIDALHPALAG